MGSDLKLYIVQSRLKQKPHSRDVVFHKKLLSMPKGDRHGFNIGMLP